MNTGRVLGTRVPFGALDLDDPVGGVFDIALADRLSKIDEVVFFPPRIEDEEDIDLVHRLDGLHRHVVGVAGADADDKNFSHSRRSPDWRRHKAQLSPLSLAGPF